MAPGSTPHHIFSLTLFTSLHFPPSDLTLQTILKGLKTPLKRWVQACLCLRRYPGLDDTLLLDRYLGSQTEGNTYCSCAASPFPIQGKNQRNVMPICMIIALDIVMTLRGSINCSTVICSPTVILAILREASSEHYGPRVYSTPYFQPYTFYFVALSAF